MLLPANNGTEQPTRYRNGRVLQYMWDTQAQRHCYYDPSMDLVLDDAEALGIVMDTCHVTDLCPDCGRVWLSGSHDCY